MDFSICAHKVGFRKFSHIPRLTPHDKGMYYCIATKNKIVVQSKRALVRVDG